MSGKHTQGAWYIAEHSWAESSIYSKDKTIATLSIRNEATEDTQEAPEKEMDANARLIAAAPDMLEALKDAHPHIADDNLRSRIGNVIMKAGAA